MSAPRGSNLDALVAPALDGDRASLDGIIEGIRDDVYHLCLRMLGLRADAEDATQEILIQVVTHLSRFRGEASLRTWVWRIATRHVLRARRSNREALANFEQIERMLDAGARAPVLPELPEAELRVLAAEVRLACTAAMVMALDRELRVSWVLAEIFGLAGDEAAFVLDVDPAAFRKRLSRARERLAAWMTDHCGLVGEANPCNCRRQIPVAMGVGVARLDALEYADHPTRTRTGLQLPVIAAEADAIERAASTLRDHPDYAAPDSLRVRLRELLDSGRYRMFDA